MGKTLLGLLAQISDIRVALVPISAMAKPEMAFAAQRN
jgi:hypothetical protein